MTSAASLVDISGLGANPFADLAQMLSYSFMRNAAMAGTVVAVVAGVIGYYVVLRRASFAAHALSHMGFAGAAGAVLVGASPLAGLLVFTGGGALAMAALGRRAAGRDVQIGTVLAFMLGLGVLFVSLYHGYATEAYSILFGEILGIGTRDVILTALIGCVLLIVLAIVGRPLLFASVDEEVAASRGLAVRSLTVIFYLLVAGAVSISVQIVGVLLIFALMVTPAAIAHRLAATARRGMLIAASIAVIVTWVGLALSYVIALPVSFFITTISFAGYVAVVSIGDRQRVRGRR